ncbi:sigma-54-dependent transcriptional regulator [Spirochaeta isovalerica]|uniref:DNA-binding NtrC family response regulator n=1 Tax=Spirochaeta isovalerica TaxID=150 RepID=A0A841RDG9_9SPIO|nr:sigma-54 dependent transcriptional regulator [Spirochaeta isovalerica]MBB6481040.1 DNA-binding NtrC family response regulator [Spirochaeta isovalerica]
MSQMSVLIVEDDNLQRKYIESLFGEIKQPVFELFSADSVEPALEIVRGRNIDLILTDYMMPGGSGMDLLKSVKEINPHIDVAMLTAQTDIQVAVDLMKEGARDYLTKPVTAPMLQKLLLSVEEKSLLVRENRMLREQLEEKHGFQSIISQSGTMENILNTAWRISASDASVLITGESGTGKEMLANAIHYASSRKDKIMRVVNIAALSETLIDSELFGHVKGAFTGAVSEKSGVFEIADGGTLFIDEVGDIPMTVQVKLLRTIQFGQIQKVGSEKLETCDIRIIAATNKDLKKMIEEGTFRQDLYYRLNVVHIDIPPLRLRKADISPLINHFVEKFSHKNHKEITGVSHDAMDALMKYDYPGNIRELENIIERAVIFSRSNTIKMIDLPPLIDMARDEKNSRVLINKNFDELMNSYETDLIVQAMKESEGNKSEAARKLGISERRIRSRIQILQIDTTEWDN